ncbi:hypothetical protein [Streptomyces sp. NRRL S-237]|uniref:hypothetical protein n=1 Tax=Streptomyces sp. NRRL S-237 TaxID=1463895 RepID=UPI0004CAADB6|nr:hypothetical protein [Streptomyces sp. NRRL S-237]
MPLGDRQRQSDAAGLAADAEGDGDADFGLGVFEQVELRGVRAVPVQGAEEVAVVGDGARCQADVDEQDEVLNGHADGPGELVWVEAGESWNLTDGGRPTPVSIVARALRGCPASAGSAPAELLGLAHEFRVPIPDAGVG